MAKYLLLCSWLVILKTSSRCGLPIFLKVNHRLESRMQEICQSGSEGGAKRTFVPTPIKLRVRHVLSCTGPQSDYRKLNDPLVQQLLVRDLLAPDPLRIGAYTAEG